MDYKEQQTQEIEALQAIYQEEELAVVCDEYPNISLRVNLKSNQEDECDSDFEITLVIELPENYPDVIPRISLEGVDHLFSEERIRKAVESLENEATNNLGMVMVFSIVSALQVGTPVTPETFLAWKARFDKERSAQVEKKQKEREAALAGRLTGKQLFLKDATLSLSDVALIEQSVEIDESLFDEEIDGLELDSDED
ncbi:RWD domain protein [Ancylostoma caninum]|uniref:RWD domain protein n=1 Tax=Ancylostoma caninum TaxID=29170 RepID=A0A368GZV9_ANCCA|nr:RWD domain protein [Ancylostoma caninum]